MNHQDYIGPSERFRGRVALVTGAGRGIGEAIAIQFAAQGAHVVLCARTRSELESVANYIRTSGGLAQVIACDVADPVQVGKLVESTIEISRSIAWIGGWQPPSSVLNLAWADRVYKSLPFECPHLIQTALRLRRILKFSDRRERSALAAD